MVAIFGGFKAGFSSASKRFSGVFLTIEGKEKAPGQLATADCFKGLSRSPLTKGYQQEYKEKYPDR